ncbi:hypothetical protein HU200_065295 [Digitaria exilis]|uniref:MATH domain-containing protein n=1 Tax=Digitaria exilis TaxID=1010633 RepID=A0A835A0B2_9POAL|nr:hypothetical protein HU200_065295 [Digitaria exilis]
MSAIVADATSGYHILKIDGYSHTKGTKTGAFIKSHPFTVGGHRWFIQYYPNGNTSESADYVSLFVYLDEVVNKPLNAQHQFCLIDDLVEETPLLSSVSCSFESYRGWELRTEEMAEVPTITFVSLPASDLHQHLGDLLQSEKGTDVVFEVGCETFKAHRCVLAARCIEASTLGTILALAEQHHCQGLKKACFHFLSSPVNLTAVLATDAFEYLNTSCPSVIKDLIAKLGT